MGLFWTIGNNNYGREAAAFLKATNNGSLLDNWEQQLRARSGRLFEGKIMGLFWTIGNSNNGREAAAFLNWATIGNKKHCVHGIQGMWYWARLQYADLETQFTWPLVHAISGVLVKVLKLIINDHYQKGNGSKIVHHKISKV